MKEYPSVIKSHVLSGFVVLSVMIASALFPSCSVAFNETIAELYPQFQELGIVPDQVGVTEAQNSGGDLLDNGFDFGWQTEQVFLDITLENRGSREVRFDQASISGTTAAAFSLEELTLPVLLPANGTAAVRVGFAPESARYSTAILTLSNANGRVLHIQLSGSGFAQPRDTEGWNTLGLWLRADRLRKSDLSDTVGTLQQPGVLSWRSLDPLRRLATAPEDSESLPLYIPGSTGSLPSLRFDEKELLAVDLPDSQNIASGGNGTTTFIAFKTSSVRFDQRLLTATFGEASQPSFPTFSLDKWYFDNIDGMYGNGLANGEPSAQFKFDVWGEGWYSFPRSPADSMNRLVEESKLYSVVLRYDSDIATPDSNVTSWLSGNAVPLSYLHSYEGNKLGPLDLNGAYGLPVSDGEGNLNQDISGVSYQYDYSRQAEPALFYNSLSPTPNNRINDLYIGRKPTGEYYEWEGFKGDIYEILVFSSALSESDIDLINDYLNLRYGIEP